MSKKKSESGKVILSERIINIGELEAFIRSAYMGTELQEMKERWGI